MGFWWLGLGTNKLKKEGCPKCYLRAAISIYRVRSLGHVVENSLHVVIFLKALNHTQYFLLLLFR